MSDGLTDALAKVHPRRRRRKRKRARHNRAPAQLPALPIAPVDLRTAVQRLRALNQKAS